MDKYIYLPFMIKNGLRNELRIWYLQLLKQNAWRIIIKSMHGTDLD